MSCHLCLPCGLPSPVLESLAASFSSDPSPVSGFLKSRGETMFLPVRKGIGCHVSQEARNVREHSHLSPPRLCLHLQPHHIQSKVEAVLKLVNSQLDHSTDLGACQKIRPFLLRVADAWVVLSLVDCCHHVLGCIGRKVVLGRQNKPNQNPQNFHI